MPSNDAQDDSFKTWRTGWQHTKVGNLLVCTFREWL